MLNNMRHRFLLLISIVSLAICMSCCNDNEIEQPPVFPPVDDDFETHPGVVNIEGAVEIVYNKQAVSFKNPYEGKGITITRQEADVVVRSTVTDTVFYVITGSTMAGSLKMYSDAPVELVMNGVSIVNAKDPALNIQSHKKVNISLIKGTSNRLAGGTEFVSESGQEDVKAAFFSEGQLIFSGEGGLLVMSRYRHGICSDNYVRINSGVITVQPAAKDGIHAKEYVEINGGTITVNSMNDGIKSNGYVRVTGGSIQITTTGNKAHGINSATETTIQTSGEIEIKVQGKAAKAFKSDGNMQISQGIVRLTTSGDALYDTEEADLSSPAGIKCDGNLLISGGQTVINSSGSGGKGVNVKGALTINNGELSVTATGNEFKYRNDNTKAKAITNDGNLTVSGGSVYALSATDHAITSKGAMTVSGGMVIGVTRAASKKGFDCTKTFKIAGGTLIGIGGASSLPDANASTQYSVNYSGSITQNAFFHIASSAGKNVVTYQLPCTLSKAYVLFSSHDLERNTNYTISTGGAVSGGSSFNGLYNSATFTGGTTRATFTVSSIVTNVN